MKENFNRAINKAMLAGAITLGISGQGDDHKPSKDAEAVSKEAQIGESQPAQEAEKARRDYKAGKWVDAKVLQSGTLDEDKEAEYINQKYFLQVTKNQFLLGRGILVTSDSTDGFITLDKNSGKTVYLDMREVGHPQKPTNNPAFQALVTEVLQKEGLPTSVLELFRALQSK
jgi:hypothetical protein